MKFMLLTIALFIVAVIEGKSPSSPLDRLRGLQLTELKAMRIVDDNFLTKIWPFTGVPTITYCNTTSTPLIINSFTISPDDIEPDETVTATLKSTLVGETVTSGTIKVTGTVDKYPILNEQYDLCDELPNVGLSCPLAPGPYDISEQVQIGSIPISGTATATAELYDQSSNELACISMTATV